MGINIDTFKGQITINLHKLFRLIHENGVFTFCLLAFISFIFSLIGFMSMAEPSYTFEWWMLIQSLLLSFEGVPDDSYAWIVIGKLFWMITFASAAFSLFLREWSDKKVFEYIKENNHTAIIGVGDLSYNYINDLDFNNTIILNNNQNITNDSFKEKGFSIKDVSIDSILQELKISNMKRCLINLGDDRTNINLAFDIIKEYEKEDYTNELRLVVRIENRELNSLFMSNQLFLNDDFKDSKIELKTYSFFEECAIKLFQDNFIDGEDDSILQTSNEYSIAIVGEGRLANKIIYEAAKIAHLPNENILNIYLITNNPKEFKETIIRSYPNIEEIPTIRLNEKTMNYKSLDFYTDDIWDINNLTNVILCSDEEDTNIEIASSMQEKTYLRKTNINTKVLFGVFNQGSISARLDEDDNSFKIFKSFGNAKDILCEKNIFEDENNMIAKLINYTYDLLANDNFEAPYNSNAKFNYSMNSAKINKEWFKKPFTDKASSLAQAKHIKMKLKTLGLRAFESDKNFDSLLELNRACLEKKFEFKYTGNYEFPTDFEDCLFNKMIQLEHNRWNAYHYLNGWQYSKNKIKPQKLHDCLLSLDDFPKYFEGKRLSSLIEWDIYAFMYIPNYLAEAKYEIKDIKCEEN